MGWPILGDEETVSAFTREILRTYMARELSRRAA